MGAHPNIGFDRFPIQGERVGSKFEVTPAKSTGSDVQLLGTVVRDDLELPLRTVVELEDGRVVLGEETAGFASVEQGRYLGSNTKVCFDYDISHQVDGVIVRDDIEEPYFTVIKLAEMGHYVLATECQYQPVV